MSRGRSTHNPFKPGDLVRLREECATTSGGLLWVHGMPTETPALVVEVDGMMVRTLIEGGIHSWISWDLEEARCE